MNAAPSQTSLSSRRRSRWLLAIAGAGIACAAVLLWRNTPLAELANADELARWIGLVRGTWWSPIAVVLLYVAGGLALFPLTLLIAATAVVFDVPQAMMLAMAGVLANAVVTYGAGAWLLRGTLHSAFGDRLAKVNAALAGRGVIAIAAIRMVPIAPFTLVNMAAGSLGVNMRDYVVGTALGVVPGIVALCVFGGQLRAIVREPAPGKIVLLAMLVAAWIGLSFGIQKLLSRSRLAKDTDGSPRTRG